MRHSSKTTKNALTVHLDVNSGGIYLQLNEPRKVVRTLVKQKWPLVAVDFSEEGGIVGIEAVGMENPTIAEIAKIVGIRFKAREIGAARIGTQRPELVSA